jgi:hypothetical protein
MAAPNISTTPLTSTLVGNAPDGLIGNNQGTFVCNGATAVTVAAPNLAAGSQILVSLRTVGGTVGAIPRAVTVTPGTGFTIAGTASDTSTYNWVVLNFA